MTPSNQIVVWERVLNFIILFMNQVLDVRQFFGGSHDVVPFRNWFWGPDAGSHSRAGRDNVNSPVAGDKGIYPISVMKFNRLARLKENGGRTSHLLILREKIGD